MGTDLLTIAMLVGLEGLLSADNALVIAIMVLGLPKPEQKKAMRYGMAGAFAFRAIATALADQGGAGLPLEQFELSSVVCVRGIRSTDDRIDH